MRIQDRGAAGLQARLQNVDGFVYILHAVDQISSTIVWNDLHGLREIPARFGNEARDMGTSPPGDVRAGVAVIPGTLHWLLIPGF
jgi:hypothetical protein